MRIIVLHARVKMGAKRSNIRRLGMLIERVMNEVPGPVDMIVLPSYPFTGPIIGYYNKTKVQTKLREFAEKVTERPGSVGPSVNFMSKWSWEYGVYLMGGPIIERAGPRLYLTTVITSPEGGVWGKYRKVHLTRDEVEAGISYGREPGVFKLKGNMSVGVFIDEDLALPELFRAMQIYDVNVIVGGMMPYNSEVLGRIVEYDGGIITMDTNIINNFLIARSREVGVPIILVGGILDLGSSETIAFMETVPVDPDDGVIKSKSYGLTDDDEHMIVEVDRNNSSSRPAPEAALRLFKALLCRNKRNTFNAGGNEIY
ncbi:MAG: carbon-nitrogen hydrolase family protein [Desulfurococcales archaeon]|nr:carbon-nitrogen hydrolase family protein [Desulfurococcales archaeon]